MQIRVMLRCVGAQLRLVANSWGVVTSNHAQSRQQAGIHESRRILAIHSPTSPFGHGLPDFGLITGLPPIPELPRLQGRGFRALSHLGEKVRCAKSHASCREEELPPEELQEYLWQQLFADPPQWWDNRRSKPTPRSPDFRHKKFKVGLWLNNRHKPAWVDTHLGTWDAGPPESVSNSVQGQGAFGRLAHEGHLEVGMCRKLCEDGRITDAVDALDLLVQRGCHVDNHLFYRVLKRCKDLVLGRRIHALTVANGYEGDTFLATHLIGLYGSHGKLDEAMRVFTKVSTPDAYNWATIIFAYAKHGVAAEAIQLYRQMRESTTIKPTNHIYVAVLKACAAAGDLVAGKEVHAHILASPWKPDIFVQTGLVNMYANCRSLEDAHKLFDRLPERDVVTWNALIAGYAQQGMYQEALGLFSSMQREGTSSPNSVTFVCLLQACASGGVGALHQGKQIHAQINERGLQDDMVIGGSLVNMYAKCGSLEESRNVFDGLQDRNVVTWNSMIASYAQQEMGEEALNLYSSMQQEGTLPDAVTFLCLVQACASVGVGALDQGKQLHAQVEERGLQGDVVLGGSLVNMYAKCGSLEDACRVFDRLPDKNVVAYVGLLQACASVGVGALDRGKQIHAQIVERGLEDDEFLGGSLVHMYARCGSLENARNVFDRLPDRNVVIWTAMIAGYAQQGMGQEALTLYRSMQQDGLTAPDSITYVCLLQACASVGGPALDQGKQLHAQIEERGLQHDVVLDGSLVNMYAKCGSLTEARGVFDRLPGRNVVAFVSLLQACASIGVGALDEGKQLHSEIEEGGLQDDVVLGGSLVNMYAKCGSLEEARSVFDRLSDKNVVTWNVMLAGYAHQEMGQEVVALYTAMQQEGITPPDSFTFVCILQACAVVAALPLGKQLHAQIVERGLQADVVVGAALVYMYAKCGCMFDAQQVFDSLPERTMEAWGALSGGYTRQGDSGAVFDLLDRMRLEGVQPDGITLLSVLTVCSHSGLVDKGREYFEAMRTEYGVSPTVEHYACMIDLLGRAGHLDEALQMAKTMPFPPNDVVWGTLLGACQKWKNVEIGQEAFEGALSVDGKDASSYVLMSNIYAGAQMWEEAKEMQARRVKCGARKKPGQSWWTDMGGLVHTFGVGDNKHPESGGIYIYAS